MSKDKFERCEVVCEYCRARYSVTAHEDEIPEICDHCFTPSLRVVCRESIAPTSEEMGLNL